MNKYQKVSLISIAIILFFIILFMIYQLYLFAQGVREDSEYRSRAAEKFLLEHPLKDVIVALRYDQPNKQESNQYAIQLVDYDSNFIPCLNKYIGSCIDLDGTNKIYFSQASSPNLQVGQTVCKPKGELIFNVCK